MRAGLKNACCVFEGVGELGSVDKKAKLEGKNMA